MKILRIVLCTTAIVSLCLLNAEAKVFQRWGGIGSGTQTIAELGGKKIYESTVTINGGKGNLVVFGFDKPISEVCTKLGSVFKNNNLRSTANALTVVHIPTSEGMLKLVILEPQPEKNQTVVFALEQSKLDSEMSQKQPIRRVLDILPDYPGAKLVFSATIDQSRTTVEILNVPANIESVKARAVSYMNSAGWTHVVETESSKRQVTLQQFDMQMYYKGMHLCHVQTLSGTQPGESILVLLHKRIMRK